MFERRLKVLLTVLGVASLIIVARLGQLQIVQAEHFRRRAEQALLLRPSPLPFVRGRILDRTGEVLVSDEPCWELAIDYSVIAADVEDHPSAINNQVRRWKRKGRCPDARTDEEIERAFRDEMRETWLALARFTADSGPAAVEALRDRARDIYNRVRRIRKAVAGRRGFGAPVAEEKTAHAVITGLDSDQQIAARELFAAYPWVRVRPSSARRLAGDATPFAHLLGRMGRVDATHVADDPNADDPFAKYRAEERLGISGVESAAEQILRGRRGQVTRDREGNLVEDGYIGAEEGRDVTLTIHAELQRRLYELLSDAVERIPESSGGAIVVLDVPGREVLALVSYPSYDPNRLPELYEALRDDTDRLPLRFRAVANRYAPGSMVKPLVCLAGLISGRITLDTREECTGYLSVEHRDRWRCWRIRGTNRRKAHGSIDVVEALIGSCNVFMYRLGERLGVDGLCSVFDMVGIGRSSGIGLPEETPGVNPTPGWLARHKNTPVYPGHARNFAIGQGELSMTPVQAANLMATYASGRYRHVTLIRNEVTTPEWTIPGTPSQWAAIRRGIYSVVNNRDGTAYRYAHFEHERYALCGKTGSATAHPWPTSYRIPYVDADGGEMVAIVPAGAGRWAIERFRSTHPSATFDEDQVAVASRWPPHPPPPGERYSHAWFGGYLQAIDATGQPDWSRRPRIAFAVVVEFGGSGGRTSGPLAKSIAAEVLDVFGPDLDVGQNFQSDRLSSRPGDAATLVER